MLPLTEILSKVFKKRSQLIFIKFLNAMIFVAKLYEKTLLWRTNSLIATFRMNIIIEKEMISRETL
jgi:hypothetical protein